MRRRGLNHPEMGVKEVILVRVAVESSCCSQGKVRIHGIQGDRGSVTW